jgi:hypothetical protein
MIFRHFLAAPKLEELVLYRMYPEDIGMLYPIPVGLPPLGFTGLKKLSLIDADLRSPELHNSIISHPGIELVLTDCSGYVTILALLLFGDTRDESYPCFLGGIKPSECPDPFLPSLFRDCTSK